MEEKHARPRDMARIPGTALHHPQQELPLKLPTEGDTWGRFQKPLHLLYLLLLPLLEQWFSMRAILPARGHQIMPGDMFS